MIRAYIQRGVTTLLDWIESHNNCPPLHTVSFVFVFLIFFWRFVQRMQFIRPLLVSLCFLLWSFTAVADEITSLSPHDTMREQALADYTNHFYLDLNYTNIRIYHQDSVFTIRGLFQSGFYRMKPPVKIGLQGKGDDEMFTFWTTPVSFQEVTYSYGSPFYGIMTLHLPSDFKVENIKSWPVSATLLAMNDTYNGGVFMLHNAALPFGEVYQRPCLYSIVPYLHQTWTRDWLLNGTGLLGVKALTLMATDKNSGNSFDITTIADIISTFPLASNHLHLRLKPGNRWASAENAQLFLATLDTGAGPADPSDAIAGEAFGHPYQSYRYPLSISVFPDPPASMLSRLMKERVVPMSWAQPQLLYASATGSKSADSSTLTIRGDALLPPPTTSAVQSNPFPDGYYQMLFKGQQKWSIGSYPMQRLVLACTGAAGSSSDGIVYQLQEGVDYITDRERSTVNKRVLTLLPGASWCPPSLYVASIPTNVENATPRFTTRNEPQLLRLLAVESPYRGYFIAVNPANFVAGAAMAMVVWPPTIYPKRVSQYPRLAIIRRSRGGSSSNAVDITRKDQNRRTFWISGRNFPVTKKGTPAPNDGPQHQTTSPSSITSNLPSMLNSIFSPHVNVSWASPPPPTTTFQVRFNRPLMPDRDFTVTVVSSSRARISFTSLFLETSHQQSDLWIGPLYVTHIKVGLVSKPDDDDGAFVDGEEGDAPLFAESLMNEEERAQSRERLCGGVVPANDGDGHLEVDDPNDAYEACLAYMEEMGFGTDSDRELDGDDGWITLANGGVYVAELMYSTEGDE